MARGYKRVGSPIPHPYVRELRARFPVVAPPKGSTRWWFGLSVAVAGSDTQGSQISAWLEFAWLFLR
jgi:hypothetical protein